MSDVEAGQWNGRPGYRPPMAAGQQYPPLGYASDGAAQFGYRPAAGAEFPQEQQAAPVAAPPPPPPSNSPQRTAMGVIAVVVLVLAVVGGLKLMSGDDTNDDLPTRADPPASQNIDDPYLPKSITPTETVPGESTRSAPSSGLQAQLVVEGSPGTMILYTDNGRARIERMTSDRWEKTVGASTGVISVNVVPTDHSGASCTISVDGRTVAHDEAAEGDTSGVAICRVTG
ncbi:hypothetical protein nbrc107696_07500 [Gordonia spumicola]|uniref:Uncharacterized protein n=1 Tax=Gordonia spumicola TaxID=589161 RepID=A0A7I9V551_9ACTN|nr:hypothetical protein nbrc107696_07500 [Gordonia spumicola]